MGTCDGALGWAGMQLCPGDTGMKLRTEGSYLGAGSGSLGSLGWFLRVRRHYKNNFFVILGVLFWENILQQYSDLSMSTLTCGARPLVISCLERAVYVGQFGDP